MSKQDTSLDEIFEKAWKHATYSDPYFDEEQAKQALLAWHTTQQAALLKRVREEVIGANVKPYRWQPRNNADLNSLRDQQRIALDNLMEDL